MTPSNFPIKVEADGAYYFRAKGGLVDGWKLYWPGKSMKKIPLFSPVTAGLKGISGPARI